MICSLASARRLPRARKDRGATWKRMAVTCSAPGAVSVSTVTFARLLRFRRAAQGASLIHQGGLRAGDKAFHIVDPGLWEDHLKRLAEAGIDVDGHLDSFKI